MYSTSGPDDISLNYLKTDVRSYNFATFKKDLFAGLEVSLLTVPQAMAYALVAGLPTSCGLYAAIFSAIIAAFWGSSRLLIVGPVNAIAILVQAGTANILYSHFREASPLEREVLAIEIMTMIALLAGVFQLLIAIFKLGRMTQFVSHSVVIGYLAGAAFAMVANQLFTFTGVPDVEGVYSLYEKVIHFVTHLQLTDIATFTVGTSSIALLLILRKAGHRLPSAAIMLIVVGVICYAISWTPFAFLTKNVLLLGSTADEFTVTPLFFWPTFHSGMLNPLLSVAFAVALLGIIETTCTAKSMAATSGQGISINQEILAIGAANLVSSCSGSMPVSVSNSRSQLNWLSGAKTRFAAIFNALFVALIVGYLGNLVYMIPIPSLAALLIVTAFTLVNVKQLLLCVKSTSSDAFVLVTTFLACIFFSLDTAFYIGVILSISLYLKKAAMPQLVEYAIEDNGELRSLDLPKAYLQKIIRVIKVEGELFFGSSDIFYTTLKTLAEDDQTTRVIILQLKNARDMDATTCLALLQLHEYLHRGGRHLVLCGMTHDVWDVMSHSGLIAALGKENLFVFEERHPLQFMQKAIARAKDLSQHLPSTAEVKPVTITQPVLA